MPSQEKRLIAKLRLTAQDQRASRALRNEFKWKLLTSIGDDCAVLQTPPGEDTLVTTDFSLEGTHFRREWHPADSVGHRCLTRGLSDIAAMGGRPMAAFLSLALPMDLPQNWVDGFLRGFLGLAKRYGVVLAGGDIAESKAGVLADVMVLGSVPKGTAILRSGASPGDIIYVSGALGGSAAVLRELFAKGKRARRSGASDRHYYPEPRIQVGEYLRKRGIASSMIDLSDGLSSDLAHICEESGVGAVLVSDLIPVAPGADLELALRGGEDYELLFTAPKSAKIPDAIAGVPVTEIGRVTRDNKRLLLDGQKTKALRAQGWEHFAKS